MRRRRRVIKKDNIKLREPFCSTKRPGLRPICSKTQTAGPEPYMASTPISILNRCRYRQPSINNSEKRRRARSTCGKSCSPRQGTRCRQPPMRNYAPWFTNKFKTSSTARLRSPTPRRPSSQTVINRRRRNHRLQRKRRNASSQLVRKLWKRKKEKSKKRKRRSTARMAELQTRLGSRLNPIYTFIFIQKESRKNRKI